MSKSPGLYPTRSESHQIIYCCEQQRFCLAFPTSDTYIYYNLLHLVAFNPLSG